MILKRIKIYVGTVGETNCYIVQDEKTKETMVIDPGGEVDKIADVYKIPESYGTFWEVSFATLKDSYLSRAAQAFIEEYRGYLGV